MSKDISAKDFDEKVLKSKGVVMVDFWAAWCPPCRALTPLLEQIDEETGDKSKVFKLNVDENQEISMKYGIQGIPTVKVFKDGKEVESLVGLLPKAHYLQIIDKYA